MAPAWLRPLLAACARSIVPPNFPLRKLVPCILMLLVEAVCASSLTSFVGYFCVDLGVARTPEDAGTWAGWLVSTFNIAQFLSSYVIGAASDALGRRPVLLFGSLGIAATNVLFGLAPGFWFAVAVRFLNGLLNGNVGVVKTYLGEITDSTNRVQVFSYIGLTWCVGSVLGTFAGGVLYDPCGQYPGVFGGAGLFARFPALLNQLVAGGLGAGAFVLGYFFIVENDVVRRDGVSGSACARVAGSVRKVVVSAARFFGPSTAWSCYVIGLYFLLGFGHTAFQTVYPLLMIAAVGRGGLGFLTAQVGYFSAIASAAGLVALVFFYKRFVRHAGLSLVFTVATFSNAAFYATFPSLEGLNGQPLWARWACYGLFAFFWNFFSQCAFSSIMTLITNSVEPRLMGSANGVSQSMVSLGRIVGTVSMSSLLAWSLNNGLPFPLNQYLPFYVLAATLFTASFLSLFVPRSVNAPREEAVRAQRGEVPHPPGARQTV